MNDKRTHIDLFTGLGGFSLAARANGIRTIAMCECDERCAEFLAKAWPGVPICRDVREFHWGVATATETRCDGQTRKEQHFFGSPLQPTRLADNGRAGVFLLTAGVPCQPASRAGKQRGAKDDRWLWPDAVRVLGEVRPTWAIFENPPGIGDVGLAGILSDMESKGYKVRVFSIPACAVGAPHGRERYWLVAHRETRWNGRHGASGEQDGKPPSGGRCIGNPEISMAQSNQAGRQGPDTESGAHGLCAEHCQGDMAAAPPRQDDSGGNGLVAEAERCGEGGDTADRVIGEGMGNSEEVGIRPGLCDSRQTGERGNILADASQWQRFVWLPCADGKVRRAPDDTFSLVDGLHRSLLGALGNSIVPQIAAEIIRAIIECEKEGEVKHGCE